LGGNEREAQSGLGEHDGGLADLLHKSDEGLRTSHLRHVGELEQALQEMVQFQLPLVKKPAVVVVRDGLNMLIGQLRDIVIQLVAFKSSLNFDLQIHKVPKASMHSSCHLVTQARYIDLIPRDLALGPVGGKGILGNFDIIKLVSLGRRHRVGSL
jgi:hypothetical protein